jgi:hypothetical protein
VSDASKNGDDQRAEQERRSGEDRRKPRSSFVERIGKARNRRTGDDRRADKDSRTNE